jgi:hypothetical protein
MEALFSSSARSAAFAVASRGFVLPTARLAFSSTPSHNIADCGSMGGGVGRSGKEEERRRWWTMCAGSSKEYSSATGPVLGGDMRDAGLLVEDGGDFSLVCSRERDGETHGRQMRTR